MPDGNLGWREAIIEVLKTSSEAMHYTEIAEAIALQGLRTEFGATPAATVNSVITKSIQEEKGSSPFTRIERGRYSLQDTLKSTAQSLQSAPSDPPTVDDPNVGGLINAFGIYWARDQVQWTSAPKILGQEQLGANSVDFCNQKGVYLLYDGRSVVYVGRTTDRPLGVRLYEHTKDRLGGRWDRFSWFGLYGVEGDSSLKASASFSFDPDMLIVTMEALLIEGLEPPQNRKRGDDFRGKEFLQVEDPEIRKKQLMNLMDEMKAKL